MAFRELDYQAKALRALEAFLEQLRKEKAEGDDYVEFQRSRGRHVALPDFPAKAWGRLAADLGTPQGNDGAARVYSPRMSGDGRPVPNATFKVPTGGGKTYLACAALSRIFARYVGANAGMVLWIVPNEAIYSQTLRALRDRDHAYRQTLDRTSANRTLILEKTDAFHSADLAANLCIMILMLQSSNRENQDSLRLFRDRGDVHGFVPNDGDQQAHKALAAAVPNLSCYDLADGPGWPMVKASMGNAMRIVRPVVVMDEGQRAVSDLAFKTLYDFNPSFVLELTATPKDVAARAATRTQSAKPGRTANILCEITGRELEREGMIKMPMNVSPLPGSDWQATLRTAWDKLEALERDARAHEGDGGRYIRPILLVQVERTGAEQAGGGMIHANDARDWLCGVAGLDKDQVAFKTAEVNDLDKPENRDLLSPKCRVRAIITKAALAEGWDCPFAYVLCALAANGNEAAMTQLVGRILRQPNAMRTGVAPLDECYVFAHRADTQATVAAIKRGLESDGLGDLARDVVLSDGIASAGASRAISRRDAFRTTDIALPQVLTVEPDGRARLLDAETDLFPFVDWRTLDLKRLAARLPKDARPPDSQLVRLRAGEHGVETDSAVALASDAPFDVAYAVRAIGDLVPNAFVGWAIVNELMERLRSNGWDDVGLGRLAPFITDELRKALASERDTQAAALFKTGLDKGTIRFALRGDDGDWIAPTALRTTLPDMATQLTGATGKPLERSLFLPVHSGELNSEEQGFAMRLDADAAVRWWHRNGTERGSYAVRGWRRGNVYPDFLFATIREAGRDRIVAIETKGEQLAGNPDTEYKRVLLETLTKSFAVEGGSGITGRTTVDFAAAVVLFGELDAQLPALIRGEMALAR